MLKHYAAFFTLLIASVSAQDNSSGRISSASNSKCLEVRDFANIKDGNPIQMNDCAGSANQIWEVFLQTDSTEIRLGDPNLSVKYCMDAINVDSDSSGNLTVIWGCNQNPWQQWIVRVDDKLIRLANNTDLCLEVPGSSTDNGVQVQTAACNGGQNQNWNFI